MVSMRLQFWLVWWTSTHSHSSCIYVEELDGHQDRILHHPDSLLIVKIVTGYCSEQVGEAPRAPAWFSGLAHLMKTIRNCTANSSRQLTHFSLFQFVLPQRGVPPGKKYEQHNCQHSSRDIQPPGSWSRGRRPETKMVRDLRMVKNVQCREKVVREL